MEVNTGTDLKTIHDSSNFMTQHSGNYMYHLPSVHRVYDPHNNKWLFPYTALTTNLFAGDMAIKYYLGQIRLQKVEPTP